MKTLSLRAQVTKRNWDRRRDLAPRRVPGRSVGRSVGRLAGRKVFPCVGPAGGRLSASLLRSSRQLPPSRPGSAVSNLRKATLLTVAYRPPVLGP